MKPTGRVLAASAVAAGLTPLNSTMIAVALPAMSAEFGSPAASVTVWVVTAYLIATIVCQMPAGNVADRIGYARTLTVGRWMFAAGAALATFAPSLAFVIAGRLFMALGGTLMIPTAMALLRVAVPEERRPRAFGAMGAVMGGAAALGPALGGLLIARTSWRVLFLVNVPLTLLSWLLQPRVFALAGAEAPALRTKAGAEAPALRTKAGAEAPALRTKAGAEAPALRTKAGAEAAALRTEPGTEGPALRTEPGTSVPARRPRGPFDWRGSVLLGTSLVLFVLATRVGAPLSWAAAGGAVVLFAALIRQARRTPAPVMDFTLFREPAFVAGAAIVALQNLAMYALLVQVPFLFGAGAGESRLGLAIMGMTASMAVMSPIGGRLAERIGSRTTVVTGGLAGAAGIALLIQLAPTASALEIGARLLLVGVGLGLSTGPSQAAALSAIAPDRSGMASAALSTLRYVGAVAGTAILGLALGGGGGETLARQHLALWVFAGAFALSALSGLRFSRTR